jgi:hypothetical protein
MRPSNLYHYEVNGSLGESRFSRVCRVRCKNSFDRELLPDSEPFSRNKYSNHPARALKVVDKREFWAHVTEGRERADTLTREVITQSLLTCMTLRPCPLQGYYDGLMKSHSSYTVRLWNVVETSDQLILEMELMDKSNLYDRLEVVMRPIATTAVDHETCGMTGWCVS